MRIIASLMFALSTIASLQPVSAAQTNGIHRVPPPPIACMPWSGCRK